MQGLEGPCHAAQGSLGGGRVHDASVERSSRRGRRWWMRRSRAQRIEDFKGHRVSGGRLGSHHVVAGWRAKRSRPVWTRSSRTSHLRLSDQRRARPQASTPQLADPHHSPAPCMAAVVLVRPLGPPCASLPALDSLDPISLSICSTCRVLGHLISTHSLPLLHSLLPA
ncbi:hypothetical protein EJ04DRAFT_361580 [Polyplosphaeria fusca]|uniref:Uncharacterized protein n=1 Tax=Polyplosphaeria fusca TaxID=682080 RepID=A0A9P4QQG0_9PLEO|nr:hypothetical protein EJ04DRAFT_361580 [Polyplosphaeria fusca]